MTTSALKTKIRNKKYKDELRFSFIYSLVLGKGENIMKQFNAEL